MGFAALSKRLSSALIITLEMCIRDRDEGGYHAALLTYYGFLSLFPFLLVVITITKNYLGNNISLENHITKSITDYFPVLGNQLTSHIHSLSRNGPALIFGVLFTLYGVKGVAASFSRSVQRLWSVRQNRENGFIQSLTNNFIVIVIGGIGLLSASVLSGFAASYGHSFATRLLSVCINLLILFGMFIVLINFCLPKEVKLKDIWTGALFAAVGLLFLQVAGGFILTSHLKTLDALYSYFAITLGLLFWIYLQAQLIIYSIEISIVHSKKLWPREMINQ